MADLEPPKPFLLRVNVEPTPSSRDPSSVDDFYKALGILVIAWGRLEGHFVACLLTLIAISNEQSLGVNVPLQWDERARIWRKAFDTFLPLQHMKVSALQFLTELEDVARDRHAIVHALWEPFDPVEPPSVGIISIRKKQGVANGLDIKRATITLDTLREIGEKMSRLNVDLVRYSQLITEWRRQQTPPPADILIV